MSATADRFAAVLSQVTTTGAFSARCAAPPDDLQLQVAGIGEIALPVSQSQAKQLCQIGRPAHFGQGEQTLLDARVRDTWQVPKSRIKIDKRQWNKTLRPMLDRLRADLGLRPGCKLTADFHSMLVYAPGQFFAPHQDSEKTDRMIGTLVVTLPSNSTGGDLVVEHAGTTATYRSSKTSLSCIAFYADCRHQVRPVSSGYRAVLTYNLLLDGDMTESAPSQNPHLTDELARCLNQHFTSRVPARFGPGDDDPPTKLVYLLDHEYTERGLSWARLKGTDANRAAVAQAVAAASGCEIVLSLAEIHEIWDAYEPDRRRYRSDDGDDYELNDLIDSTVSLTCWLDQPGAPASPTSLTVNDAEVCASTPTVSLTPYESEYEGYMGNYGNTMDRWYRRAALVLWPYRLAFAVRAEASPEWALDTLAEQIRSADLAGARENAATLAPFWNSALHNEQRLRARALRVALALDEPDIAAMLLRPIRVESLVSRDAQSLAGLAARYGAAWTHDLVAAWFDGNRLLPTSERLDWLTSLPSLCEALCAKGGVAIAKPLVASSWTRLRDLVAQRLALTAPSQRERALAELGPPSAAILISTAVTKAADVRDEAVGFLCQDNDNVIAYLMSALRAAGKTSPAKRRESGLDTIARHCVTRLQQRLAGPQRADDDWSIALPNGCTCAICRQLGQFLGDSTRRSSEWPLVQQGREHVQHRINQGELTVRQDTRRSGRPYTLVLTKNAALFDQDHQARHRDEADLAWLHGAKQRPPRARQPG